MTVLLVFGYVFCPQQSRIGSGKTLITWDLLVVESYVSLRLEGVEAFKYVVSVAPVRKSLI